MTLLYSWQMATNLAIIQGRAQKCSAQTWPRLHLRFAYMAQVQAWEATRHFGPSPHLLLLKLFPKFLAL